MDAYLMSGVRRLVYGLCGKKADFPSYAEWVDNLRKSDHVIKKVDNRSADQIFEDLINGLKAVDDE